MQSKIKNIRPSVYENMLMKANNIDTLNTMNDIESYIRSLLGLHKRYPRNSKEYWLLKGWTYDDRTRKPKKTLIKA